MLALICGTGGLPAQIAKAQAEKPLVCVMDGLAPDELDADLNFRLETLGSLLIQLGQHGVTDVCLCGAIDRPSLDPSKLDEHTAPLIPLISDALTSGDDGALRAVMGLFEQTGFTVRAAHELVPDLIAPPGVLSAHLAKRPNARRRKARCQCFGSLGTDGCWASLRDRWRPVARNGNDWGYRFYALPPS